MFSFQYRAANTEVGSGQPVPIEQIYESDFIERGDVACVYDLFDDGRYARTFNTHDEFATWRTSFDRFSPVVPDYSLANDDEAEAASEAGLALPPLEMDETIRTDFMEAAYSNQGSAAHYKGYLEGLGVSLEWLEANQLEPFWRANPKAFYHAIMLLASRYQSRLGRKDDELQEQVKYLWYVKFATAFAKNGYQPIRTADVDAILAR